MPRFRYGQVDGVPYLTIDAEDWTYVRRADDMCVYLRKTLPDTVLASAIGRRIADVVEIPGIGGRRIAAAEPVITAGLRQTMLRIGGATNPD